MMKRRYRNEALYPCNGPIDMRQMPKRRRRRVIQGEWEREANSVRQINLWLTGDENIPRKECQVGDDNIPNERRPLSLSKGKGLKVARDSSPSAQNDMGE